MEATLAMEFTLIRTEIATKENSKTSKKMDLASTNLHKMDQYTKDSGKMIKDTVKESTSLRVEAFMKEIGWTACVKVKEKSILAKTITMKAFGKMTKKTVVENKQNRMETNIKVNSSKI